MDNKRILEKVQMKIAISKVNEEDIGMKKNKLNFVKKIGIAACALLSTTGVVFATVAINLFSTSCFSVLATLFISSNILTNKSFVSKSMHMLGTPDSFIVFSPNSSNMNPAFFNIFALSSAISICFGVRFIMSGNNISCEKLR